MAGISDVVSITITTNTRTPTRAGFGTPLLMGYHALNGDLVRTYTDLSGMSSDGFASTHPLYRMAQAVFSQNPRPPRLKVARLPAAHTHTSVITISTAVEGEVIRLTVISPTTGAETDIEYTVLAAASTTSVAVAVEALVEAVAGVASAPSGATITVTPDTAGDVVYIHSLENCTIRETTGDAGYDDALTALQAEDDDWYVPLLDTSSETNVDLVAAWAETRTKIFLATTSDSGEASGTGTFLTDLQALGYDRTGVEYAGMPQQYAACAWAGRVLARDAGSITWAFKELIGVTPDYLTPTQEAEIHLNGGNTYQTVGGLNVTRPGVAVSGEYLDIVHGTDWLKARLQERIFGVIANADKIPYTDASVDMFVGEILSVLGSAVDRSFLAPGTIAASGPVVSSVALADRAARVLPDLKFSGNFAGAIHKTRVEGTLSV